MKTIVKMPVSRQKASQFSALESSTADHSIHYIVSLITGDKKSYHKTSSVYCCRTKKYCFDGSRKTVISNSVKLVFYLNISYY